MAFEGFSREMYDFFLDIRFHNHKTFFEANRSRFQRHVKQPMEALAAALIPAVEAYNAGFDTRPGRAVSRIRRDTRFARDKTPYRDHMWIGYKRPGDSNSQCFGLYFEIYAESWRFGAGYFSLSNKTAMDALRERILAKPQHFEAILQPLLMDFQLMGEDYKRGYMAELPPLAAAVYRKKAFYLEHQQPTGGIDLTPALADRLAAGFGDLRPLYEFVEG